MIAAPMCTCGGGPIPSFGPCPIHGSPHTRDELEMFKVAAKRNADERNEARSQADALAEALERIVGDKTPVADFHFAGRADDREDAMMEIARSALASYRSKPAPGETK